MDLSAESGALAAREREQAIRTALDALGLLLFTLSTPDADGNVFSVIDPNSSPPERRFATVEDLEAFIAERQKQAAVLSANPGQFRDGLLHGTPKVGDKVHYVSYGTPGGEYPSVCRAAIVTEVQDFEPGSAEEHRANEVGLCVLNPTGMFFNRAVRFDPGTHIAAGRELAAGEGMPQPMCGDLTFEGGGWHWPERA